MAKYSVRLKKKSNVKSVTVNANSEEVAITLAENNNPGYSAIEIKKVGD